MKKLTLLALLVFLFTSIRAQEFEGIEKGDKEVSFFGMVMAARYATMGYLSLSGGYYFTDKLMAGAAPGVIIASGFSDFNLTLFGTYNFVTDKPAFPYLKASLSQLSFKTYDGTIPFFSNMSLQAGGGYKFFFSERFAWDSNATIGFNFGSPVQVKLTILTGLTFIL